VARPKTTVVGVEAYPDIHTKAAALLHSLCRNYALVDGNKRLAWTACQVFLGLNGEWVEASEDDRFDLMIAVASGAIDKVDQIAEQLRNLVQLIGSLFVEHRNSVAPCVDDVLDAREHLCASRFAVDTRHEQGVVVGVDMADRSDHGETYSVAVQGSPRRRCVPHCRCRAPPHEVRSPRRGQPDTQGTAHGSQRRTHPGNAHPDRPGGSARVSCDARAGRYRRDTLAPPVRSRPARPGCLAVHSDCVVCSSAPQRRTVRWPSWRAG
jgi:death on curing protein